MLLFFSYLLTFRLVFTDPTLINGSTLSHISANNNQHKYSLTLWRWGGVWHTP